jgi:DNA polymerase-3 subunit epsilon
VAGYLPVADAARRALSWDVREVERALRDRLAELSAALRYEEAAQWRDRLEAFARGAARAQEVAALAGLAELIAARPTADRGWEIHVVRHGRLAAAGTAAPGTDPRPVVAALLATAEQVAPPSGPVPAGLVEESVRLLRWLESGGVRLVPGPVEAAWALPAYGAGGLLARLAGSAAARVVELPVPERGLRPAG